MAILLGVASGVASKGTIDLHDVELAGAGIGLIVAKDYDKKTEPSGASAVAATGR